MIQQTKNAIAKLKEAGLPRDYYGVNTERNYVGLHPETGKSMFEYGNAFIWFKVSTDKILPFAESMAKSGLHVIISKFDTIIGISVKDIYGKSGLWIYDYRKLDDYQLPKINKVI